MGTTHDPNKEPEPRVEESKVEETKVEETTVEQPAESEDDDES